VDAPLLIWGDGRHLRLLFHLRARNTLDFTTRNNAGISPTYAPRRTATKQTPCKPRQSGGVASQPTRIHSSDRLSFPPVPACDRRARVQRKDLVGSRSGATPGSPDYLSCLNSDSQPPLSCLLAYFCVCSLCPSINPVVINGAAALLCLTIGQRIRGVVAVPQLEPSALYGIRQTKPPDDIQLLRSAEGTARLDGCRLDLLEHHVFIPDKPGRPWRLCDRPDFTTSRSGRRARPKLWSRSRFYGPYSI